jgi:hypothetical protein
MKVFPFRRDTFIVSPSKAKNRLGWASTSSIEQDIEEEINTYLASGKQNAEWSSESELKYDSVVSTNTPSLLFPIRPSLSCIALSTVYCPQCL